MLLSWLTGAVVVAWRVAMISYGATVGCPRDSGPRPAKHQCLQVAQAV